LDADPQRIRQALSNLLENALVHGGERISVTALERGGTVEVHVADDGPGFPPELGGRETERFARGGASRSRPGSGLGLAIVEAIAVAHGGSVRIAGGDRGGADVALILPSTVRSND
jgi:signal transduction histidine kinase